MIHICPYSQLGPDPNGRIYYLSQFYADGFRAGFYNQQPQRFRLEDLKWKVKVLGFLHGKEQRGQIRPKNFRGKVVPNHVLRLVGTELFLINEGELTK